MGKIWDAAIEEAAKVAEYSVGRFELRPDNSWQDWNDACRRVAEEIRKLGIPK